MRAAVLCALVAAVYFLRLDDVAGLVVDDAWYVVLAKAIAGGDGYRLISSATTPIVPSVPPLFPLLLSPAFLANSSFPGNLVLLKLVSILAMAGVGYACWIDLTRYRGVARDHALWIAGAVVLTPAMVFLATSTVMSEGVFTLAQVLAVIAIERAARAPEAKPVPIVVAGLIAAMATLIRTAGVALIVAAIAYLIAQRRLRSAAIFAATVMVCIAPWQIYARANQPAFEERFVHGGTIAYSYSELLSMSRPGSVTVTASPGEMAARAVRNIAGIATRDVGAAIVPVLFRGPSESGEEVISVAEPGRGSMGGAAGTMIVSALISLVIVAGIWRSRAWLALPTLLVAASVAMIALVGSQTFRYVVPLTPFLLWLFWRGIAHPGAARIAVLVVLGFHLVDHAMYLRVKTTATPAWIADARDNDEVLAWISEHLTEPGAIASTNPGLVYLRTGRKGVASAFPERNWEAWKRAGVRYVVALKRSEPPPPSFGGRLLFQTKRRLWVVQM